MNKLRSLNIKYAMMTLAVLSLVAYSFIVSAAAPSGGYAPGATLDPDCAPGDTDCLVTSGGGSTTPSNGLQSIGSTIGLGGTLSQDTLIDQDGFDFEQTNTQVLSLFSYSIPVTYSLLNGTINFFSTGEDTYLQGFSGYMDFSSIEGAEISSPQAFVGLATYENDDLLAPTLVKSDGEILQSIVLGKDGPVLRSENLDGNGESSQISIEQNSLLLTASSNISVGAPDIDLSYYPDTRDDSGFVSPVNFLYTNGSGDLMSAPLSVIGGGGAVGVANGLQLIGSDVALGGTLSEDTEIAVNGNLFSITDAYSTYETGALGGDLIGLTAHWIRKDISPTLITAVGMLDQSLFGGDADSVMLGRFDLMGGNATNIQIQPTSGDVNVSALDDIKLSALDDINIEADGDLNFTGDAVTWNVSDFVLNLPGEFSASADDQIFIGFDDNAGTNGNFGFNTNGTSYNVSNATYEFSSGADITGNAGDPAWVLAFRDKNTDIETGFSAFPDHADQFIWDNTKNVDIVGNYVNTYGARSMALIDYANYPASYTYNQVLVSNNASTGITMVSNVPGGGAPIGNGTSFAMNDQFRWGNISDTWMILSTDGYLGIGNTLPSYRFDVKESGAGTFAASFTNDANDATASGVRIQAGEDNGSGTLLQFADGDGGGVGSITFSGATTTYGTSSDRRLKSDIVDTRMSIDDLMKIQVRDYTYNQEGNAKIHTGYVAQELVSIVPDAVYAPSEGMWSVDYGKLTPLLVKSVQDLNLKLSSMENLAAAQNAGFRANLIAWLADAANGIENIFSKKVTTEQLCVRDADGETCITRAQLNQLLGGQPAPQAPVPAGPSAPAPEPDGEPQTFPSEEPAPAAEVQPEPVAPAPEQEAPSEPVQQEQAPETVGE